MSVDEAPQEPMPIRAALAEAVELLNSASKSLSTAGLAAEALALQPEIATLRHFAAAWRMRLAPGHEIDAHANDIRRTEENADPATCQAFDDSQEVMHWVEQMYRFRGSEADAAEHGANLARRLELDDEAAIEAIAEGILRGRSRKGGRRAG